ncbi:MAG: hypothetical protein HY288_03700 [Planctomycetia bacterium]|nr:hypothetical protein [Planctomycetia bacterium]
MEIVGDLFNWAKGNVPLVFEGVGIWIVCLAITVWAARYYLISIPPDYFARKHKPFDAWRDSHPALRWTLLIGKNFFGGLFLMSGLVMLVTPGPGWVALLLGLYLVDLPGKRAVERRILQRPPILHFVNRMRAHAQQPALEFSAQPPPGE